MQARRAVLLIGVPNPASHPRSGRSLTIANDADGKADSCSRVARGGPTWKRVMGGSPYTKTPAAFRLLQEYERPERQRKALNNPATAPAAQQQR
jgi:hypothetical protein